MNKAVTTSCRSRSRSPAFALARRRGRSWSAPSGEPALLQEALDLSCCRTSTGRRSSPKAIEAIGQPEFELKSTEPVVVHAMVPVRPTIDLNAVRSRFARHGRKRKRNARCKSKTRCWRCDGASQPLSLPIGPVQWGDSVRADVRVSTSRGRTIRCTWSEDAEFRVAEQDTVVSLPGFVEHLIGLERGRAVRHLLRAAG